MRQFSEEMPILHGLALALLAVAGGSPSPAPAASAADVARWVEELRAVRYGSFSLGRVARDFAEAGVSGLPPTIRTGSGGKTLDVCFEPYRMARGCGYHVVVRAGDVIAPPAAIARTPAGTGRATDPIGLTYAQLLARFHADEHFASKNVVRDSSGGVVFISALDEDPPPSRYDHGFQSYVRQEYFFRGGVVAAYAYQDTEN